MPVFQIDLAPGRVVVVVTPAGSELVLAILARENDRYWVAEFGEGSLDRSRHNFWIVPALDVAPLTVRADLRPLNEEVRVVAGRPACTPDVLDQAWWWEEGEPWAARGAAANRSRRGQLGHRLDSGWDLGRDPGDSLVVFRCRDGHLEALQFRDFPDPSLELDEPGWYVHRLVLEPALHYRRLEFRPLTDPPAATDAYWDITGCDVAWAWAW